TKPKRGRGRPRKGEVVERPERRLERQPDMGLDETVRDLPKACAVGSKRNAKGRRGSWTGCRPRIDAADGEVPVGRLLTSASPRDSQAAIPLATMTGGRVTYFHELMDSAHDAPEIHRHGEQSGHVPIIDVNPRRDKALKEIREMEPRARANVNIPDPKAIRYSNRSTVERVNARLKDGFGGRHVRVRGHAKVFAHIMFGILALAIDQLQRHMP
ncbi:MAG: transposase, partial [Roseovarius sp.]|nr:transposase [Roseovarius sp.]